MLSCGAWSTLPLLPVMDYYASFGSSAESGVERAVFPCRHLERHLDG